MEVSPRHRPIRCDRCLRRRGWAKLFAPGASQRRCAMIGMRVFVLVSMASIAVAVAACGSRSAPGPTDASPPNVDTLIDARPWSADRATGDLWVYPECSNMACAVHNDCCSCVPYDANRTTLRRCTETCEQPMCEARGIQAPQAYCLRSWCLLAAGEGTCLIDKDCARVNDCCTCAALPAAAARTMELSCRADCERPSCDAGGLGAAVPRCVRGSCRLVLP